MTIEIDPPLPLTFQGPPYFRLKIKDSNSWLDADDLVWTDEAGTKFDGSNGNWPSHGSTIELKYESGGVTQYLVVRIDGSTATIVPTSDESEAENWRVTTNPQDGDLELVWKDSDWYLGCDPNNRVIPTNGAPPHLEPPSPTSWYVSVKGEQGKPLTASLEVFYDGGPAKRVTLKGVCYSPCPINGSNAYAPALGDWFWDSFSGPGYEVTGWQALWARDLPNIRSLGINTIRVYSMLSRQLEGDGSFPSPWNSGHKFTHKSFLDMCWNNGTDPIYVLIGIPLPQAMFWLDIHKKTASAEIEYWTNVLRETVEDVGKHPAVLGFIIQNEQDAAVVTYPNASGTNLDAVKFWWGQVEKFGGIARTAAPGKLVGMAVHDDPNICGKAQEWMAQCPSLDFWGVNTYQVTWFQPVFDRAGAVGPGYQGVASGAIKPVILTEWGIPATGHANDHPSSIYANDDTIEKAAQVLRNVLPQAFGHPPPQPYQPYDSGLNLGLYYFEYCDEWWNQGGSPNIYTWHGGPSADFPNGYWDQDGFGLYSQARGAGLCNEDPIWSSTTNGPILPIDDVEVRQGTAVALKEAYKNA